MYTHRISLSVILYKRVAITKNSTAGFFRQCFPTITDINITGDIKEIIDLIWLLYTLSF